MKNLESRQRKRRLCCGNQPQCQISYKSALFLMNRTRFAIEPDSNASKLTGIVECMKHALARSVLVTKAPAKKGHGTNKQPAFVAVELGGSYAVA